MDKTDYNKLRNKIADELADLIAARTDDPLSALCSAGANGFVCKQAALAAACVLVAFVQAWRMMDGGRDE